MALAYRVAICDRDGWREFVVTLPPALAADVAATRGPLMSILREGLADARFNGHAMIIEPA